LATAAAGGPGAADAAWAELLAESADRGTPSPPTDTVRSAARRLVDAHGLDEEAQQALRTVVGIVEESRYGGVDAAAGALPEPTAVVRDAVSAGSPLTVQNRLLPPSLLGRRAGAPGMEPSADRIDDAAATRR
jgi:hypothetical protein